MSASQTRGGASQTLCTEVSMSGVHTKNRCDFFVLRCTDMDRDEDLKQFGVIFGAPLERRHFGGAGRQ